MSVFNENTNESAVVTIEPHWTFDDLLTTVGTKAGDPSKKYQLALKKNRARVCSLLEIRDEDDVIIVPQEPGALLRRPPPLFGTASTVSSVITTPSSAPQVKRKTPVKKRRRSAGPQKRKPKPKHREGGIITVPSEDEDEEEDDAELEKQEDELPRKKQKTSHKSSTEVVPEAYAAVHEYFFAPKKASQGKVACFIILAQQGKNAKAGMSVHTIKEKAVAQG